MAKFQVIYGNDLWSSDGYKIAYYSCKEPDLGVPSNILPARIIPLCEQIAKEYGTSIENISYTGQYLMAGRFGQEIYTVQKDGRRLFDFYALTTDENNRYIYGGY